MIANRKEAITLLFGDVFFLVLALYLMLFIRYHTFPSSELFYVHFIPFAILFAVWVLVFYTAGLYEKHRLFLKNKIPGIILRAQIVNSALAVLFFYFIPYFGITPKTNLFLYLVFSFGLLLWWRVYGSNVVGVRHPERAMLIGSGSEMHELKREVNSNNRYYLKFVSSIDLDEIDGVNIQEEIVSHIYSEGITNVVINLRHDKVAALLPHLYNLIFSHVRFIEMHKVYEDIFDRVPLSLVQYSWFMENISVTRKFTFDFFKRVIDIFLSLVVGLVWLCVLPFVAIAIKIQDGGPITITQTRVGRNNKPIKIVKFRSMTTNDNGEYGKGIENKVTRVGEFLRTTRIDELPQWWNVFRGDLSLIGPRPELPDLVQHYTEEVPYYNVRHLVTPGLSGWAQVYHENHPHHGADSKETAVKLSYDLYYLKNRSMYLDFKIIIHTVRALLARVGR